MPTTTATDDRKPIPALPPLNWRREVPKYLVVRDVFPSPNSRHRHESPFSQILDGNCWQQADRIHRAGEVIQSTEWPHPTFQPKNYAAQRVLAFFGSAPKSRLARSPWFDDQVRLDDGLSNPLPNFATILKPRGDDRLPSAHPNAPRPAA
jgi:hypothetical protein